MKVTKKWLKEKRACCSEKDMDRAEKDLKGDIKLITKALLKENRFSDANWLLTELMDKKQCVEYAVFAAKQVLHIFEERYPKDDRPKKAIEAAEKYLKDPSENNRKTAYAAYVVANAAYATNAAANAAYATNASDIATNASDIATNAAYATNAANAAANAAYAAAVYVVAANATNAAYVAAHSAVDMKIKIIEYGVKILN